MSGFVEGLKSLFTGPDTAAQQKQIAQQKDQQDIALSRQRQTEQQADQDQSVQAGLIASQPKGRRLLLASTGEGGVAAKQTTLG